MSVEGLVAAIISLSSVPVGRAQVHAEAAEAAALAHNIPVEVLLGIAYVESRYDPRALSRKECESEDPESCTRKTGIWPKDTKPPKARPSWYCGPMQTGGYVSWDECQRMRTDVAYAYETGAAHLQAWLDDKRCAKLDADPRLRCALAGYNGGNQALASYKTSKYANWVLALSARISARAAQI